MRETMPWDGASIPENHVDERQTYPFIQWVNGRRPMAAIHPVLGTGGFGIAMTQFMAASSTGAIPPEFTPGVIPHTNGETDALLAPMLRVAVVAHRFFWTVYGPDRTTYSATYTEGARGKTQALAFVDGLESMTPIMLTFTGMASKYFSETLKSFSQQIVAPAANLAKRKFPRYAFWMPVVAGPPIEVGQGNNTSSITPPVAGWDTDLLKEPGSRRDMLASLYVGQAGIDRSVMAWDAAQEWAKWQEQAERQAAPQAPAPVYDDPRSADWLDGQQPAYQDEDDIPF